MTLLLLLGSIAAADITVKVTPEPIAVTKARFGDVRGAGLWRVLVCAETETSEPVSVSALRLEMAIADLSLIDPESAAAIIRNTSSARRRDRIIQGLMMAGVVAAGVTAGGYVQVTGREAGMVALGLDLANRIRGRIESGTIVLDPARMLTGTVDLAPGECTSRITFAALVPRSRLRSYFYQITAPHIRRVPAAGITSIPR